MIYKWRQTSFFFISAPSHNKVGCIIHSDPLSPKLRHLIKARSRMKWVSHVVIRPSRLKSSLSRTTWVAHRRYQVVTTWSCLPMINGEKTVKKRWRRFVFSVSETWSQWAMQYLDWAYVMCRYINSWLISYATFQNQEHFSDNWLLKLID